MSFVKAIEDAQKIPELPEELADQIPDLLAGGQHPAGLGTRVVDDVSPSQIRGMPKYDFEYNCARLTIGPVERGYVQGQAVFEDEDDSERLKEIMDMNLNAEAIIFKKQETFLKSGAVVVWVEWGTRVKPPPKEGRSYLTEDELRSPGPSEEKSDDPGD